jgi:predicted molibdopterin-dependent oxidoreductase YjgC
MPRFFFDLQHHIDVQDQEGRELTDASEAVASAVQDARTMVAASALKGSIHLGDRVVVRSEEGDIVARVGFQDVVDMVPESAAAYIR